MLLAPTDRRVTLIRAVPKRTPEVFELYPGMNGLMDEIFQGYDETEFAVIADFVRRTAQARRESAALLDGE